MRWKMPNVAVVAVAAAAALYLVTAETMLVADGGSGGDDGGGGGGGSGRKQHAATAAADRHQDIGTGDKSSRTPAAVQCSSCLAHEGIKSLSIELIKMSILNKLGMDRPPVFSGRQPPKVPTDLPPLQDLMRRYNNDVGPMVVMPHIRHKSHHYNASGDDGGADFQNEEASYTAATSIPNEYSADNGGGDDEDDDYHVKKHKFLAFAQLREYQFTFYSLSSPAPHLPFRGSTSTSTCRTDPVPPPRFIIPITNINRTATRIPEP